jgi:transcriptional regulator with XRE-family HTH domain
VEQTRFVRHVQGARAGEAEGARCGVNAVEHAVGVLVRPPDSASQPGLTSPLLAQDRHDRVGLEPFDSVPFGFGHARKDTRGDGTMSMGGESAGMLLSVLERNGTVDPRHRPELVAFARWLTGRMHERRLGRNQLAQYLGVSQSSISEYARALRRPRLETLRKMAVYFETPLEELEALLAVDDTRAQADVLIGWGAAVPATHPVINRPAVLYYGPNGEIEGADDLDEVEAASVRTSIATFRRRRAARGVVDVGGGADGSGDPGEAGNHRDRH